MQILKGVLGLVLVAMASGPMLAVADTEVVRVLRVLDDDDTGVIQRRNGEQWLIEKGVGANAFWRFEGKFVVIDSPGLFCGAGATLVIPDVGQEARIWSAKELGAARPAMPATTTPPPAMVESNVDGAFNGWDGKTVVQLTNGQLWQQAEYHYHYHYAYRPKVTVFRAPDGFRMIVAGVPKAILVKPVR